MKANWEDYQVYFWKKYLYLEEKVMDTEKFVTFCRSNRFTFSNVFEELLVVICTEIEAVFKEWLQVDKGYINEYLTGLLNLITIEELNKTAIVKLSNIELTPFDDLSNLVSNNKNVNNDLMGFGTSKHLKWWKAYNNIKHNKLKDREQANLENVLNALAALFILESLRIKNMDNADSNDAFDCPYKPSQLFDSNIETKRYIDNAGNSPIPDEEIKKILRN
jgi:hypothetical protein